jgi:alanine dehydrogenase
MHIGIPKETTLEEKRVALAPAAVKTLVSEGHQVYIETGAGQDSHFTDKNYQDVGGIIVYSSEEAFQRGELVAKVHPLSDKEVDYLSENQIVFSFLHLAVSRGKFFKKLLDKKITAISYELIERKNELPVLQSMSEIAGQLAVRMGERYLGSDNETSRGILLGGITGVAPAAVVILGAGVVGLNAARVALGRGAHVIVLDKNLSRLRRLENLLSKNITTVVANSYTIERGVKFADLFIGAIQSKGEKSPLLVTEEMVKSMKKGAVIVDVSIDQGGCVETSRPTSISDPVYVQHGVIHFCVPNMPAMVPRTATYGLSNSTINYIVDIADHGFSRAAMNDSGLVKGVCTHNGQCTNEMLAKTFNLDFRRLHIFPTN